MIARRSAIALPAVVLAGFAATAHGAGEPSSAPVPAFDGSHTDAVAIEVPAFFGIEPRLQLTYGSQSPSGNAGVGWNLSSPGTIERTTNGRGAPTYTTADTFVLDGRPLVTCTAGMASPSCLAGGTHATEIESYRKIVRDTATNGWRVWTSDGSVSRYTSVDVTAGGTFRWRVREIVDPRGHTVTYDWWCDGANACYLDAIRYGASEVRICRELRPDPTSAATGKSIATTRYRVRSVVVRQGGALVRGYNLTYATSAWSGRSLLAAVEQRGRDASVDATGALVGGTLGLRRAFTYQNDAIGLSLIPVTPTAPGTVEAASWFKRACAISTAPGAIVKTGDPGCIGAGWNAGASSTRAIVSGDGATSFQFAEWQGATAAGLSSDDHQTTVEDVDYAFVRGTDSIVRIVERGVVRVELGSSCCSTYRVAVEGGVVRYYQDGNLRLTSAVAPTYPLRLDVAMHDAGWSGVRGATLTGALADVALWCGDGRRLTGDFNGDGKGDLACDVTPQANGTRFDVRLGTVDGFAPPTPWLHAGGYDRGTGDFDGDGKDDLWLFDLFTGEVSVARSTGGAFAAPVSWGSNGVCRIYAGTFQWSTGDFNGDGRTDMACQRVAQHDNWDGVYIGVSTGASFLHSRWLAACDAANDSTGDGDFDGDGRADWMCQHENGDVSIHLARVGEFEWAATSGFVLGGGACPARSWTPTDVNGDAKLDLACASTGAIRLSTGRGFITAASTQPFCAGFEDQLVTADLGGDGMVDWICNASGAGANDITVRPGRADGLGAPVVWRAGWCPGRVSPIDFDGDRKADLLCDEAVQPVGRAGTPRRLADLLASATTGFGGAVGVEYAASTTYLNTNNPPPQYVVARRTTDDGRGTIGAETFHYEGGLVDQRTGRFLGFRYIRRNLPCSAATCPYVETWYHQGYGSETQPERIDEREAGGQLVRATVYELATDAGVAPYWTRVVGTWHFDYGACKAAPCPVRRTYVAYQHDGWGNVVVTRDHGDADLTGDERRVERVFRPNPTAFLVASVAAETEFRALTGGVMVRQTLTSYDGAATWDQAPVRGERTRTQDWLDATGGYVDRTIVRDANGNVDRERDRLGAETDHAYDASGRLRLGTTNAVGHSIAFAWEPVCEEPATITDPNGAVTAFTYDGLCRLVRTDRPGGDFEIRRYPTVVNATTQYLEVALPAAGPTGELWTRAYLDGLGRSYRVTRRGPTATASIIAEDRRYGVDGRLVATAEPRYATAAPAWTTRGYDVLGRVVEETGPRGTFGRVHGPSTVTTTDPGGHVTTTTFDAAGRMIRDARVSETGEVTRTFAHDAFGMTRMTDAAGNTWTWRFDSLGHLREERDPDRGTTTYVPDPEGRRVEETDALGQRTRTRFDLVGRGVERTTRFGTAAAVTTTFAYDEPRPGAKNIGRLTSTHAPTGITATDYDAAGRRIEHSLFVGPDAYTFHAGYDAGGRQRWLVYPDDDTLGTPAFPIVYDDAGRIRELPGVATAITWTAGGELAGYTAANTVVTTFTRDVADRLTRIRAAAPSRSAALDLTYHRDLDGQIERIDSPDARDAWLYAYDELHRLGDATNLGDATLSESFAYDRADNITWSSKLGTIPYPAPGAPRPHGALVLAGAGVAFHANGNLIAGGNHAATWTGDGLASQIDGRSYDYDALGSRIRVRPPGTGAPATLAIGDHYRVTGGVVTKYVALADRVIHERVGASWYWLHTDHQHSIRRVTDATGAVVTTKRYRPYGYEVATGTFAEAKGFTGETRDDTGLLYLHARYYDPEHARFISPDPSDPSHPRVGGNRYGYGLGNPVAGRDPSGLMFSICSMTNWECWAMLIEAGYLRADVEVRPAPTDTPSSHPPPEGPREPSDPGRPGGGGGGGGGTGGGDGGNTDDPDDGSTTDGGNGSTTDSGDDDSKPDKSTKKPTAEGKLLEAMKNTMVRGAGQGTWAWGKMSGKTVHGAVAASSAAWRWGERGYTAAQRANSVYEAITGSLIDTLIDTFTGRDIIAPTNEAAGIIRSDVERWACRPGGWYSCN